MKKLLGALLALFASAAFGATTVPVQLLNPVGSTAGQAVVSTGASSAPGWSNVTASGLVAQAANTVVANVTASSASPTAVAMPSCSASGSAIQYTSGTGFTCATSYALTTGATFTGAITPSQTAGIVGTTTNNNANAGSVGEYVTAQSSLTSISAGVASNYTSVSLTAGDWDCSGSVDYVPAGTTTISQMIQGVTTTSATVAAYPASSYFEYAGAGGNEQVMQTPVTRISLSATTTVYLTGFAQFANSTAQARGFIRCRRVR